MRNIYIILLLFLLSFLPRIVWAEPRADTRDASARPGAEIVADQQAKAFRFIIDGTEVGRLDAAGLHVRGSIEYGGTLTDTGVERFDQSAAKGDKNAP